MAGKLARRPFSSTYYNASLWLIGANILVFLLNYLVPNTRVPLAMVPALIIGANAYWEFVTYMFVHASVMHILFNMIGLFFFGPPVERRMGSSEFLLFYFIAGIGSGVVSFIIYVLSGAYGVILLGASGAIFGVLLAYATFFPDSTIYVFGLIPVRAPLLVAIYALIELVSQIFSFNGGVAHLTHLAGLVIAYCYLFVRTGVNPIRIFLGDRTPLP